MLLIIDTATTSLKTIQKSKNRHSYVTKNRHTIPHCRDPTQPKNN